MAMRTTSARRADVLTSLQMEVDAWVASASAGGEAYLIPLSYHWDGRRLVFATLERSVTTRNLRRAGRTRVALPSTADVVLIDGAVEFLDVAAEPEVAEGFAARVNWDPRGETSPYIFFAIVPERVLAWRDVAELTGREIMRDGVWLDD